MICLHHKDFDGYTAAAVMHLLGLRKFMPIQYGLNEQEMFDACIPYEVVYIVDFNPPQSFLDMLYVAGKTVHLFDHHPATKALEIRRGTKVYNAGPNICGATLVWDNFYETRPKPELLVRAASYDSWDWVRTKDRKAVAWNSHVLANLSDPYIISHLAGCLDTNSESFFDGAEEALARDLAPARSAIERATRVTIGDRTFVAVNSPTPSIVNTARDLDSTLTQETMLIWCMLPTTEMVCSLRVAGMATDPIREFAESFGGGGHEGAAAFKVPLSVFASWTWHAAQ